MLRPSASNHWYRKVDTLGLQRAVALDVRRAKDRAVERRDEKRDRVEVGRTIGGKEGEVRVEKSTQNIRRASNAA
jgi:hypothetical protein